MKVWDKVKFISSRNWFTSWHEYEIIELDNSTLPISVRDDNDFIRRIETSDCELVQEDKLPHELLWLDRYFCVKKDESDPLWSEFLNWYNDFFWFKWVSEWQYYWYDWNSDQWVNAWDEETYITKSIKIITLAERDRCVNKKSSQTKQLSKPIRSCEHNWSIYKEDTIDWVSIEDMKTTRDNINKQLLTHRNLFIKFKKHD